MDRFLPPIVVLVVAAAITLGFSLEVADTSRVLVYLLVPYAIFSAIAVYRLYRDGTLLDLMRFRWGDISKGGLSAVLLIACVSVGRQIVAPSGSPAGFWVMRLYMQLGRVPTAHTAYLLFSLGVLMTAVLEEMTWRGLVQQILEERLGVRNGWLAASGLYALAHVPSIWVLAMAPAGKNPLLVLAALLCGTVWGFMSGRLQRMPPSLISHGLFTLALATQFRLWNP